MKRKNRCGVYCILNLTNNHRYIGSSIRIERRWRDHRYLLNSNRHHSRYLQRAWNAHSKDNFTFNLIEECVESKLIEREQYYLDKLIPEYNMSKVAGKTEMTDDIRRAIGDKNRGENNHWYGKKRPEHSELMTGEGNSFHGKHHTEQFKINSSLRKRRLNDEEMSLVVKLAKDGLTKTQIAKELNCSMGTINRVLNNKIKTFECDDLDIDFRARGHKASGKNNSNTKLTWDIVEQIRVMRNQEKLPLKIISEKFGVSVPVISSVATFRTWTK